MTKPIIVREDGTLGPSGLKMVREMAANHKTQRTIAAALGIPYKKFTKLLERNKGDNPEREAWEAGFAEFEQQILDRAVAAALAGSVVEEEVLDDDGNPVLDEEGNPVTEKVRVLNKTENIALMFLAKTQLGWSEKPTGPMVQDNRIQITIPAPRSFGDTLKALGQHEVADFRKDKSVPMKQIMPPIIEVKKSDDD